MSDTDKTLPSSQPTSVEKTTKRPPLNINKTGAGMIKQSFSHGRSKTVVVEKKKRRILSNPLNPTPEQAPAKPVAPQPKPAPKDEVGEAARKMGLSSSEYLNRQRAIEIAHAEKTIKEQQRAEEEKKRQERTLADQQALATQREEELKRLQKERAAQEEAEHARQLAEEKPNKTPKDEQPITQNNPQSEITPKPVEADDLAGGRIKKQRNNTVKIARSRGDDRSRRHGKLTIVSALSGDDERQRSLTSLRRAREREKARRTGLVQNNDKVYREVTIPDAITIADLANRMTERASDIIKYLKDQGTIYEIANTLDGDTAQLVVEEFGHTPKRIGADDIEQDFLAKNDKDPEEALQTRTPIIAVMGHVDHGKTSLIDALRTTDIASGESGGITQHIGAYQLNLPNKKHITVLDTPGHAAFATMRTRGAQAVDIVVLVIAADDGVKDQTIESIKHAKASNTPLIIAVTKMDTYEADQAKIEQQLLQYDIVTESLSGDVQAVGIAAPKKIGLDELIEAILLQAEVMDLRANPNRKADGVVVESKLDKGRGSVASLLVKRGTLRPGDIVVAGDNWGKVKAITDERNARLKTAIPSQTVEVLGLNGPPAPGELFAVVESEIKAREITEYRIQKIKNNTQTSSVNSMEQMLARLKDKTSTEFPILLKADVRGSVEAIRSSLQNMGNEDVQARIIHGGAGGISESDILLAKSSHALIIAFNVRASRQAKDLAEKEGVEIRYFSVIYELLEDIKSALEGLLAPEVRETFIGYAEVLEVFNISKLGKVAGCKITEGKVERGAGVRLLRDDVVIHEGELSTLKRFKEEVTTVRAGTECGIGFAGYHDLHKGDQIECFTVTNIERTLD